MSEHIDPTAQRVNPPTRVPLKIEEALAALAMALLCLITLGNVIARYLTNYSFAFTEEYSIALMVIVTLLGASVAFAADRHIRIAYVIDRFPAGRRLLAELGAAFAVLLMYALLVVFGARMAWDDWRFEVTSPGLGAPQWIYTIVLPVLSLVIVLRVAGRVIRIWKAGK